MPTSVTQPDTFVLTDTEAAQLQSCQLAQQQKVTGTTPVIRYGSIAVPIVIIALVAAIDWVVYDWTMPASLFVLVMAVFVAGMATQTVGYWLNLQATKQRLRAQTRQVFEPRTVRFTEDGIEQSLPDLRALHLWRGIDRVERASDLILIWAGNLLVSAVPVRAFPAQGDAQEFLEACRRRANAQVSPAGGS
jgi:hypothetical protein